MQQRKLGNQGLEVSSIGLGCMGLTWAYAPLKDDQEAMKILHRSLELGINFWDTAEVYGPYNNEALLGRVLQKINRQDVIIATKFGFQITQQLEVNGLNSCPAHIRKSVEGSLKRLNTDYIDLYYQHRLDPKVPIEDTVIELSNLVKEGKIKYLGLSEVGVNTIRRAHSIHPISVVQTEYSLWERGVEQNILPVLKELGIGFVAYSPLGRGFLAGGIEKRDYFDPSDWRYTSFPRLNADNFAHNLKLVKQIKDLSDNYQIKPAQLALAWLLRQNDYIVPIPGTKKVQYLEENVGALQLSLPASAWISLDCLLSSFQPSGLRYPEEHMQLIDC